MCRHLSLNGAGKMKKIKCKSCSGSWIISNKDLERQRVCPFCASKIYERIEFSDYNSLDKAIYGAISYMGESIIQNPKKLSGFMLDIAPALKKEIRIFAKTVTSDYAVHIKKVFESEPDDMEYEIKKLRKLFIEEEGLSENSAEMLISGLYGAACFSKGIGISQIVNAEVTDYQAEAFQNSLYDYVHDESFEEERSIGNTECEKQNEKQKGDKRRIREHIQAENKECQLRQATSLGTAEKESIRKEKKGSAKNEIVKTPLTPNKPKKTYDITLFKDEIESAEKEMANGNTASALKNYLQAANNGFIPAYNSIAEIYYKQGDYKKAWKWYLKSAETGDSTGEYYVAVFYKKGLHVQPSLHLSMKYFLKSADHGNVPAMLCVAQGYEDGIGCDKDKKKALEYNIKAANRNNPEAQYKLGLYYQTDNDMFQAAGWFKKAHLQGHPDAKNKLDECISRMPLTQRIKWMLN